MSQSRCTWSSTFCSFCAELSSRSDSSHLCFLCSPLEGKHCKHVVSICFFHGDSCSALRFCVLLFTEGMPQPGLTPLWLHWRHAQLRLRSIYRRLSTNFTKDSRSHKWIWCVVLCTEPGPQIPGTCHMTSYDIPCINMYQ